jgi:hypothetical protein
MSNPDITLELHKNICGDLPDRLTAYAAKLTDQPKHVADVLACVEIIRGWLKQDTIRVRCVRSLASWEWLRDTCTSAKCFAAATVLETKLEQWHRAQSDAAAAVALREEREAFEARGEDD